MNAGLVATANLPEVLRERVELAIFQTPVPYVTSESR